jgi:predicted nucleotidyltransferase
MLAPHQPSCHDGADGDYMQLDDASLQGIREWAARTDSVHGVWLFGSRARDQARLDSDVDIAIALMPPKEGHDWARGNYEALGDAWQSELAMIFGRHVSLELVTDEIRTTGILLWIRDAGYER